MSEPAGAARARQTGLGAFLLGYARPYLGIVAATLVATVVFAAASVLLLPIFRLILTEALRVDAGIAAAQFGLPSGAEEEEGAGEFGFSFDLEVLFDELYGVLQRAFSIDAENVLWILPALFVVVFIVRSAADFVNGYLFQLIGLGATNDLRVDLYEAILRQSSRFYAEHPSGELVSRVGNDVAVMQNAVSNRLLDLFQQSVTLIAIVWYLLSLDRDLALVCFVAVPAVGYPIVRFGQSMRRASRRSQERLADLSNLVNEAVRGHRVVKAFGMEAFELGRFRDAARRHLRVKLRTQLLAHGAGPAVESIAAVAAGGFLVWAGRAIAAGRIEPSELLTFLVGLVMLYDPMRRLNKVNLVLQEALAAAQRIHEVMRLPQDVAERPGAPALAGFDRAIRFEGVSFAYEREAVLRDVELEIPRGQVVAVVGPSGAGKSTLVNLLPRFFDPERGRVTIDGVDLREVTLASLRRLIGIVTQDTVLFNDTIAANIAYGQADAPMERVRAAAEAAYADEFVRQIPAGYDAVIGESGLRLSGGQRQRLAIARALYKDPPILVLDEATSHLDSESEALVQKALYNLMSGRTALVIAHRLSTVTRADRILVMERGRIVEEGRHDDLVAAGGVYQRLHALQFRDEDRAVRRTTAEDRGR